MDVAVIGAGTVGSTLGLALARAGHAVTLGVGQAGALAKGEHAVRTDAAWTDVAGASAAAPTVVLAVPGPAVLGLVQQHAAALDGHLVVDATNGLGSGPAYAAAAVRAVPRVRYARAVNTLGVENLQEPGFAGMPSDMFFYGRHLGFRVLTEAKSL